MYFIFWAPEFVGTHTGMKIQYENPSGYVTHWFESVANKN